VHLPLESVPSNQYLRGDFYINSWSGVASNGFGSRWIYKVLAPNNDTFAISKGISYTTYIGGPYPVVTEYAPPATTAGSAWHLIDYYDGAGNFLQTATSSIQVWP
jgi:hypothetical protein